MNPTLDMTIREVVATDYRTAAVFQRHGIDFCCNGCRTLEQGCRDAGVNRQELINELNSAMQAPAGGVPRFNTWDARTLASYIVANHHGFVRQAIPPLLKHTKKIAAVHGERHAELIHIASLFERVADELTEHMAKEESVIFPFIGRLEESVAAGAATHAAPFGSIENPIRAMESEHQFVGDAMAEIRHLTDNYTLPDGACTTYRVCFEELEAFERDLHEHVHLENNVLFPKAAAMEASLV